MRIFAAVVVVLVIAAAHPVGAQQRKNSDPPPPPPFHVTEPTRPIKFSRINNEVGLTTLIGQYGDLIICSPQIPVYGRHAFSGTRAGEFAEAFDTAARAAGYRLAAGTGDLFADSGAADSGANLQVGAIIHDLHVKGCHVDDHFLMRSHAEGTITVEWQVYDPLERKILFKATTYGTAKVTAPRDFMTTQVARESFQEAARTVLSDPNFLAVVRDPNGDATTSNTLFPESTPAAAPSIPRIPRLQLATTSFQTQVEALRRQVVTIFAGSGGTGSAFFIADGLLLTNEHVIHGSSRFKARFLSGREIAGEVVASNARRDIALLKTESMGLIGLPLRLEPPPITSRVWVIGSPLGVENEGSVTSGIISAFRQEKQGSFIQSDVGVTHGNSGGPMFDEYGNVIGLTDLGIEGTAVNRFIPIDDALKVLQVDFDPASESATATAASTKTHH